MICWTHTNTHTYAHTSPPTLFVWFLKRTALTLLSAVSWWCYSFSKSTLIIHREIAPHTLNCLSLSVKGVFMSILTTFSQNLVLSGSVKGVNLFNNFYPLIIENKMDKYKHGPHLVSYLTNREQNCRVALRRPTRTNIIQSSFLCPKTTDLKNTLGLQQQIKSWLIPDQLLKWAVCQELVLMFWLLHSVWI